MRKGENIFKRKDGRWEARYIKGYELSGKAKYGFCYGKSYKEAKEKVSKCKAEIVVGRPVPPTDHRHAHPSAHHHILPSVLPRPYQEGTCICAADSFVPCAQ